MTFLQWLFSADSTLCTVFGYRLSPLEALAVILSLWGYYELIRRRIRGLVVGVFSTLLLAALFKQIHLYSDMLLMLYYSGASLVAIRSWKRNTESANDLAVSWLSLRQWLVLVSLILLATCIFRLLSGNLHKLLPEWFDHPARYVWADALTTALCIAASILLIKRKVECMGLWLIANLISLILYFRLGAIFLTILYIVYSAMDLAGLLVWNRHARLGRTNQPKSDLNPA